MKSVRRKGGRGNASSDAGLHAAAYRRYFAVAPSLHFDATILAAEGHLSRNVRTVNQHSFLPNIARILWDRERGDTPAIIEGGGAVSYGDLRSLAAGIATELSRTGLNAGDRVGILLDRGARAAAAFFGVLAAGGVAVNINEKLRPRQVEYILRHASARMLITSAEILARQPRTFDVDTNIIDVAQLPVEAKCDPVERIGSDVAQIIYTSGSTGLPKGVTISHGNLWAGIRAVVSYLGIRPEDRIASLLPFSFDYGLNQLLCAVGTGAALVVETSPFPQTIVSTLREQRVTVLPCVPPLWLQLLGVPAFCEPLPALRVMTNTGGLLPLDAIRRLRRFHPETKLFLMYGLTEAFRGTYLPPEQVDRRPDSIGRAIPGSEVLVLREDGTLCEPGEVGELVQRGPTVAVGYWNDPESTAKVYRPNPLRLAGAPDSERVVFSGDLVRRDEDGYIYFVGRRDRMIKSLGFRVSPDEVADVLYGSGQVAEAVVVGEPDGQRGERIVAYVVLAPGGELKNVEAFCRVELPRHMQPARIEVRADLPRTPSGKHDARGAHNVRATDGP